MNFFLKYKKLLILFAFFFIILLIGYFIYYLFLRPLTLSPTAPVSNAPTQEGELPTAPTRPLASTTPATPMEESGQLPVSPTAQGGLTKVTAVEEDPLEDAALKKDGTLQYYSLTDGKFYRLSAGGEPEVLTDKIFYQVENITWNSEGDKAVLEYPDGSNIIYNFTSDKQITLPKHWQDFAFSPAGDQIVFKSVGLDPTNRWLATISSDGSKTSRLESIGENEDKVYPSWSPNNQSVAMFVEGTDFNRQEVYFVGLNKENFKSTTVEGRGFQSIWSPAGARLLYSVYSSDTAMKPLLWTVNAQGETIGNGKKNLEIETWADKCVFADEKTAYCAVPEKLDEGAGLFPELAQYTNDYLYQLDLQSGTKKLVAIPDGSYNISDLLLSSDRSTLYFTDKNSKKLYQIKLK